jgi:hypothetical protein
MREPYHHSENNLILNLSLNDFPLLMHYNEVYFKMPFSREVVVVQTTPTKFKTQNGGAYTFPDTSPDTSPTTHYSKLKNSFPLISTFFVNADSLTLLGKACNNMAQVEGPTFPCCLGRIGVSTGVLQTKPAFSTRMPLF